MLACLQGIPYLSAPAMCLLSLRTEATAREVRRRALGRGSGEGIIERRLAVGALVLAAAVALLLFAANVLPQVTTPTSPARRQALKQLLGGPNPAVTSTAAPQSTPGEATPTVSGTLTPQGSTTPAPSPSVTATATPQPSPTSSPQPTSGPTPTSTPTP